MLPYDTNILTDQQFFHLSQLSNITHLKQATKEILIPRIVGTPGHKQVRNYIVKSLKNLKWSVKIDSFYDTAPIMGNLEFHNIVATYNPNADHYLVLGCHYDSKYIFNAKFLGATDSAIPCAIMLNLAQVLHNYLQFFRDSKHSIMLLFFDGEEAFKEWSVKDSLYGSRHLAKKWLLEGFLHKIDLLIVLDLLGASDPKFYSFFKNTDYWYTQLLNIETRLLEADLMECTGKSDRYFQPIALHSFYIEDDYIPFLKYNVPTLHIIPLPFPSVWHTPDDNGRVIDFITTENLARIIRLFTMEYLFRT